MKEIFEYRALLIELVKRDIKKKYRRSVLGILWSMLNPFFTMLIIAMVFSSFFKFAIENFPVYLLTGQLIFNFFFRGNKYSYGVNFRKCSIDKEGLCPKTYFSNSKSIIKLCKFYIILTWFSFSDSNNKSFY